MVVTVLNASPSEAAAQILLSHHLTAFADVDVIAGQKHYPAHRAVLAVHSLGFQNLFSPANTDDSKPFNTPSPDNIAASPNNTTTTNSSPTPVSPSQLRSEPVHVSPSAVPTATPDPLPGRPSLTTAISPRNRLRSPDRYRVHIALDDVDDTTVRTGWALVYAYIYGARVHLDTEIVLAALPICRAYRFDALARVLDAFLCSGAVSASNCTRVYSAATTSSSSSAAAAAATTNTSSSNSGSNPSRRKRDTSHGHNPTQTQSHSQTSTTSRRDADAEVVQAAAWAVMKEEFSTVRGWEVLPYGALVRLLKLNDLNVGTEMHVYRAVESWVYGNESGSQIDDDVVAGLVKLVRFPTMTMPELEECAASDLVQKFGVCRKYVSRGIAARADERRGLVRNVVMESSPVYRRRRTDALTFSDRVTNWKRVDKSVHTSSRYFAGCLWNLIVEVRPGGWVGLYLGCLSEREDRDVDVELDLSVFVVRHTGTPQPDLHSKQIIGARFSRSGQRIGFPRMIKREDIESEGCRLLLRDTLFIGASIRLRSSSSSVIGIVRDRDDNAESESTMI